MADNSNLIVDALQKTDPALAKAIDAENSWKDGIQTRGGRVAKYRRYERGNHDANLTAQMKKMLRLKTDDAELNEFNDNYMRIVVDKMAGRLNISSIASDDETIDEWIDALLETNDFDSLQGQLYRGAIRDADSYVLVDPATLHWVAAPAYDGFNGTIAIFDQSGLPAWAVKLVSVSDNDDLTGDENTQAANVVMRVIVYQPKQITFWKGREGTTELTADPDAPELAKQRRGVEIVAGIELDNIMAWPPGEIPLIHVVNQKDNYTAYGESELRPAIPLQDALNRTLHSMIMASEFSAFNIIWSIGKALDVNEITPGAVLNLTVGSGDRVDLTELQIEFLKSLNVGQFKGSDISQYTNQIDKIVKEISQATQTPIYGITAQGNVSGDALRQLEIGLIGKIKRFQRENTAEIRRLINLTALIQNTFTVETELPPAPKQIDTVAIEWQTPEILDVGAQIDILVKMRKDAANLFTDDWFRTRIGGLLGMDQKKIAEEGEKMQNRQSLDTAELTAAGTGGIPRA